MGADQVLHNAAYAITMTGLLGPLRLSRESSDGRRDVFAGAGTYARIHPPEAPPTSACLATFAGFSA